MCDCLLANVFVRCCTSVVDDSSMGSHWWQVSFPWTGSHRRRQTDGLLNGLIWFKFMHIAKSLIPIIHIIALTETVGLFTAITFYFIFLMFLSAVGHPWASVYACCFANGWKWCRHTIRFIIIFIITVVRTRENGTVGKLSLSVDLWTARTWHGEHEFMVLGKVENAAQVFREWFNSNIQFVIGK